MTIPGFRDDGWLPIGHHRATIDEVVARFGGTEGSQRASVMKRLAEWFEEARAKGLRGTLLLDGSFVSGREAPGDFDALFLFEDSAITILAADESARALVDHAECERKGFHLFAFPSTHDGLHGSALVSPLAMWDVDTRTGIAKGILEVAL